MHIPRPFLHMQSEVVQPHSPSSIRFLRLAHLEFRVFLQLVVVVEEVAINVHCQFQYEGLEAECGFEEIRTGGLKETGNKWMSVERGLMVLEGLEEFGVGGFDEGVSVGRGVAVDGRVVGGLAVVSVVSIVVSAVTSLPPLLLLLHSVFLSMTVVHLSIVAVHIFITTLHYSVHNTLQCFCSAAISAGSLVISK